MLDGFDCVAVQPVTKSTHHPYVARLPVGSHDYAEQNPSPKSLPASIFCIFWIRSRRSSRRRDPSSRTHTKELAVGNILKQVWRRFAQTSRFLLVRWRGILTKVVIHRDLLNCLDEFPVVHRRQVTPSSNSFERSANDCGIATHHRGSLDRTIGCDSDRQNDSPMHSFLFNFLWVRRIYKTDCHWLDHGAITCDLTTPAGTQINLRSRSCSCAWQQRQRTANHS